MDVIKKWFPVTSSLEGLPVSLLVRVINQNEEYEYMIIYIYIISRILVDLVSFDSLVAL